MTKSKLTSSTMWMSFLALLIVAAIIALRVDWAAGIGMVLVAIPTAYVTGNKAITFKNGRETDNSK